MERHASLIKVGKKYFKLAKKFKNYVNVFTCNRIIVILQSILEFP